MEKVSIVLPAYNVEPYIARTLASLTGQTYRNLEILVVEDCSQDGTRQKILDAAREDGRILPILPERNGGVSRARNMALDAMTGDWVCFCDGDDWYEPTFVERMLECAHREQADYILCDYQIAADGKRPMKANTVGGLASGSDPREVIALGSLSSCTHMFSAELFRRSGLRYPVCCRQFEELPVIPALARYASRIGVVDAALYNYFQRGDGTSASNAAKDYRENFIKAFSQLEQVLGDGYEQELEYHAVYALHYGDILVLCKQKADRRVILERIRENRSRCPNYRSNPYVKKMGIAKRMFLRAEDMGLVGLLRLYAKLHSACVN